ncbi:MAG: membrane protein insertion efficiency factor YidD [Clostridia bacterium]|nr:membrane protein insertion efficiency factor YidD [Clostridia bacterium]
MKKISIFLIKLYKLIFSPLMGNQCRFYPTCSQYTKEAIEKYGFLKGWGLGIKRILRCNPFCKGGYDPLK